MAHLSCSHADGPDGSGCCPTCGLDLATSVTSSGSAPTPAAVGACRACGVARHDGRFCEACGHPDDADPSAVGPPSGWTAVVRSDPGRFAAVGGGDEVEFPGDYEWRVAMTASSIRVGRRSRREPRLPELDLTGPPTDPGVSRRHARLLWHDQGWTLFDLGSSNGTTVNASPVVPHRPTLLASGDTIGVGLWTLVRVLHADDPGGSTGDG